MAKKQSIKPQQIIKETVAEPVSAPQPAYGPWSIYGFRLQAVIVGLLAFLFYINTSMNEYAHDDGIVIVKNEYVLEGFAGIPAILTKDAYDSYYRQLNTSNQLSGGRYRPLSIISFAVEQQFMGAVPVDKVDTVLKQAVAYGVTGPGEHKLIHNMHIRHVFNVLWYMLSVIVILYFLRYVIFKEYPIMALMAAVIFTIHPIHTEVVANVKSRDEIMSLLFICATFIFEFKYRETKKISMLIAALSCYLLAFLSKEYAITLIVLLPLSLYLFNRTSFKNSIIAFVSYAGVIAVYMLLRHQVTSVQSESSNNEVLNNPYLFASYTEKLATEIGTSLNYLKLLIFPHPLSADYSFDSIPYKDFTNPWVWVSIIVHGSLFVMMIAFFKKIATNSPSVEVLGIKLSNALSGKAAAIMCFAITFYVLHLLLICNIIFDIGATMGERLIYHSSLGFAIAVAYLLVKGAERFQPVANGYKALAGFTLIIVVLCGFKTITRNADWKNDSTLFSQDLKTVPNSVLVNANVAASYITISDYQKTDTAKHKYLYDAIKLLDHTLTIHPTFVAAYLNRGIAWFKLGNVDQATFNINKVRSLYPTYPTLPGMYKLICDYYLKNGWERYGKHGRYAEAVNEYKKGLAVDSTSLDLWYNMGGAYYTNKQIPEALYAFSRALRIDPKNVPSQQGYSAAMQLYNQGIGQARLGNVVMQNQQPANEKKGK